MTTRTDSVMLSDDTLDRVAGGGLISDVGQFATTVVKGAVHYADLAASHIKDAESYTRTYDKTVPALFDRLMKTLR